MFQIKQKKELHTNFCIYLLLILCTVFISSCGNGYEAVKAKRSAKINAADDITIAVIWDKKVSDFMLVEGVQQAAAEMNERGGLFGKHINIDVYYSDDDAHEQRLATKIAKDPNISAVIGHRLSGNAIPASITYEYYGLLFVSPSASNNNLTNHGFTYTFRTIPSDKFVSDKVAKFMQTRGHKKVAIVDDGTVYGKGISDGVMESLSDAGLVTAVRRHYAQSTTDFKPLCSELIRFDFDAIFLGGSLPLAAEFMKEARQMGMKQNIFGGDSIDSRTLEKIAGGASNNTIVPTPFNLDDDNEITRKFVTDFKKLYKKPPDTRAALGYDSFNLVLAAMKKSKSSDPVVVASNMRFFKNWQGVAGTYSFNMHGDLENKEVYFKFLNQTRFVYFDTNPADDEEEDDDNDAEPETPK